MAKKRFINEILSKREIDNMFLILKGIACNIFEYDNLEEYAIMEDILFFNNKAALFYDKHADKILPLRIETVTKYDIYRRPFKFIATAFKDYREHCVNGQNCVVIYDQKDVKDFFKTEYLTRRYAEKIALCDRLIELNTFQQKATKLYQIPADKDESFKAMLAKIDTFEPHVVTYEGLNLEDISTVDMSTNFIADKIFDVRQKLYDDYIQKIGGVSYSEQKKERLITDEIYYKQGGTLIIRNAKLKTRQEALDKFNKLFGTDIKIKPVQDVDGGDDNVDTADTLIRPE